MSLSVCPAQATAPQTSALRTGLERGRVLRVLITELEKSLGYFICFKMGFKTKRADIETEKRGKVI